MIAKIKTDKGIYDSIVFAIFKNGWESEALVFNQDYTYVQKVPMYKIIDSKIYREVFIYNTDEDGDWVNDEKYEGYTWILENLDKVNDTAIFDKCKILQASVKDCDWFEIKDKSDIDGLMCVAIGFHDSYVKNIYVENEKQYIHFNTTWGCEILFELDGNAETNLVKGLGHMMIGDDYPLILDSSMFFDNNLIYWVDDDRFDSSADLDKSEYYYFCANRIKWKLIIQ